ncbi:MAG: 30S ribosomal protein S27e [Candidatus Aenigmatarchaeota archaeon]
MKVKEPDSKFLKVSCSDCGNVQVLFNKPSQKVECRECSSVLCDPTGGMGKIYSKIEEVFG